MHTLKYMWLLVLLLPTIVFGKIIETAHFAEINKYITPKTLVLLDVDDTLLIPSQTLGSDVWFLYRKKCHENTGLPASKAFNKALAEWEGIRHLTEVSIVEKGTETIVEDLQRRGICVMGLTTQGLELSTRTQDQLALLKIDLTKTAPWSDDHYFINDSIGVLYRKGLLSTCGSPKGKALMTFLGKIGCRPEHILYINDKATHLKDAEKDVLAANIDFTGLRYSYSDSRVENFDPEIAEIQWQQSSFAKILSDDEAFRYKEVQTGVK